MRSANAISWLEHKQHVLLERLDDSFEFWRRLRTVAARPALLEL